MHCPYCSGDSQVVDSRIAGDGVRRRRLCNECRRRFTTYEKLGLPNIKVVKRSGKSEPFSPDKLVNVLDRVCRDRPAVDAKQILRIARTIEAQLIDERVKSIRSGVLAARVLAMLQKVDKIAYQRLAADYIDETGQLRTEPRTAADDEGQLGLFEGDKD